MKQSSEIVETNVKHYQRSLIKQSQNNHPGKAGKSGETQGKAGKSGEKRGKAGKSEE